MSISRRLFLQQATALFATSASFPLLAESPKTNKKIGVVLDSLFFKHNLQDHPENALRLKAIDDAMTRDNLWDQLTPVKNRMVQEEELLAVHHPGYIEEIRLLSEGGGAGFYNEYQQDTYYNEFTNDAARMAAGSHINLNLAIYDRSLDSGFALLRPPGHHALEDKAMGFCIFNSDVIAAKALQKYRDVERVAIIDFDVHHGNGTQDLTANDPSIMAVSIHQHPYWPLTGGLEFTGNGEAQGTTVNCPFQKHAGDETYLRVFDEIIAPKLAAFKPDHIIVFAGYDAHWQDPLAEHLVTVKGFNQMVQKCQDIAKDLCQGRVSFSLGGGYNTEVLAECVTGSLHTLLDNPEKTRDTIGSGEISPVNYNDAIKKIKNHHLKNI